MRQLARQSIAAQLWGPDGPVEARDFIGLCNKFGRDKVVARHRARSIEQAPTMVPAPATQGGHPSTVPALAAGLTAPTPAGITLAWLGEQYLSSGNRGNANTQSDYLRDLRRCIYPYFRQRFAGDVDIAMIMTRPLPTRDGGDWPFPTISAWKHWLGQQPRYDRDGEPMVGTLLKEETRRNIESLLSQVFNFALAYDPLPLLARTLLARNPCTSLGLIRPEPEECLWLEFSAAEPLLKHLDRFFAYFSSSRSPDSHHLAVLACPGFARACSHPRRLPGRAALSCTALLRQDGDEGLPTPFELSNP